MPKGEGETKMKYTNNIEKIVDLSRFAMIHMGDEDENCNKWDNAETLIECMIEAINNEQAKDNEDIVYKDLRINKWKTIKSRLGDLIGYEVVEIEIDGYKCITKRINNEDEQEISERVYPYDARHRYPMQEIEAVYSFKQY